MTAPPKPRAYRWRVSLAARLTCFAIAVMIVSAGISAFIANLHTRKDLAVSLAAELLSIVNSVAPQIDGDLHSLIRVDAQGALAGADEFEHERQMLLKVKAANRLVSKGSPIYTLRPAADFATTHELEFVVMTDRDETGEFFTGNRYGALPHHLEALAGRASTTGLYEDSEGFWISAAAPIFDVVGAVVGIVQADRHIDHFRAESRKRMLDLLLGALVSTLLAGLLAAFFARGMVQPFRRLVRATENIAAGKFDDALIIDRTDEVGELAASFNRMAQQLKATQEIIERTVEQRTTELRESEVRYRSLVVQLPAITYHATRGETCTWSYVSPQIETLLGFTPAEWLASDRLWFEQIHPDDRAIPIDAEAVAVRTGNFLAEYRMFNRTGDLRWFRDQAVFVPSADRQQHALYGVMMDITEAKAAEARLAELNRQLRDASRRAGMAEVATGVLHNVGNVLNSVNISASLALDRLRASKVDGLGKAAALLAQHEHDLGAFLTIDPQGRRLPGYLQRLAELLATENAGARAELEQLATNVGHIKEIVAMQQSYAQVTGVLEDLSPERLVEDALRINSTSFARHGIEIVRDFHPAPPVRVDKHKVLQILINLLRNAKHAAEDAGRPDPRIAVTIDSEGGRGRITVRDNGVGIAPENLTNVFRHGFTTKKNGHGFGLHSGANAAKEMGGSLQVQSAGLGTGATFTLELPIATTTPNS